MQQSRMAQFDSHDLSVNNAPISSQSPVSPSSTQEFPDEVLSLMMKASVLLPLERTPDDPHYHEPISPKTVRFHPQAWVRETLSRHDMSQEERCDYWLTAHEYRKMRRNYRRNRLIEELYNEDEKHDHEESVQQNESNVKPETEDACLQKENRKPQERRHNKDDFFYADIYDDKALEEAISAVYF